VKMAFADSIVKQVKSMRPWMKSKGWEYVHGCSMSVISKLQFGGTHSGCTGLKSVPMIVAWGYLSAESPNAGSASDIKRSLHTFLGVYRGNKEFTFEG